MGYRGDDLDLRVPQVNAGEAAPAPVDPFLAPARPRPAMHAARGAPIWVDEVVLECCNHAFDVAAAHRAIEVRLEHLVYALTRVDEAADALEARGVRVAALRREAATVIATEIPADPGSAKTMPSRGETFEEVLRHAASRSYRRQAPVSVSDVVYALFDSGVEFPSLLKLMPVSGRRHAMPPEAMMNAEPIRERIRPAPAPSEPTLRAPELTHLSASQASVPQTRLDALEAAVRNLTNELSSERNHISGVLQDLQRELMSQREDTARLSTLTPDKIQAALGDRLQGLEQALLSGRGGGDSGAVLEKLSVLERALQAEIASTRTAIQGLASRPDADVMPVLRRIDVLENAIGAERERAAAGDRSLAEALETVRASLARQPNEVATVLGRPLIERLDTAAATRETYHAAAVDAGKDALRRLAAIEEALAAQTARAEKAELRAAENHEAMTALIKELTAAIAETAATANEARANLTESLTRDFAELHEGLAKVNANQHTIASTLDAQSQESAVAVASLIGRMQSLEQSAGRPIEMLEGLSGMVEKMHKVTVERYYRRNRFWYWLFGTDDWLAASWPSQSARIAEELRNVRH